MVCSKLSNRDYFAISALILVSILSNLVFYFQPGSTFSLVKTVVFEKNIDPVKLSVGLDHFLSESVPKGNVLLRFEDFKKGGETGRQLMPLIYYRSVYALYPRKVLVGEPTQVISRGTEIDDNLPVPDDLWLELNDIDKIVTFTRDVNGSVRAEVK